MCDRKTEYDSKAGALDFATLSETLGIATHYLDVDGVERAAPPETIARLVEDLRSAGSNLTPIAPHAILKSQNERCFTPTFLLEERAWGISAQLYELSSERNWGIGDFEDLKTLCKMAAEVGADFIGLNPLHALFLADPGRHSPYSPSNRLFLNPLYLAVDKVPGYQDVYAVAETLAKLRATDHVDYHAVSSIKLTVLRRIWKNWSTEGHAELPPAAFEEFKAEAGEALLRHCQFESLSFAMVTEGRGSGWRGWPQDYQDCCSSAVQAFAKAHLDDIEFIAWTQWVAARQLQEATEFARKSGLRIGLYLDFAVGEAPDGSSTWSNPDLVLSGMHIGAPPDAFSIAGQDWGLVPVSPMAFVSDGSYFRRLIDRTARFAGAMRLDHVISLRQLFLIPSGCPAREGTYLRYPFEEIIAILASVSQHRQTIMIGEDLGNVPTGFRAALLRAGMLGYSVLYFEEAKIHTDETRRVPLPVLACLSTHDLIPLAGWWRGDDILFAEEIGLCTADIAAGLRALREARKEALLVNLQAEGLMCEKAALSIPRTDFDEDILIALHQLLARKRAMLTALRLADLVGESRPTNIPGTTHQYPNWTVKLRAPISALPDRLAFRAASALSARVDDCR